MRVATWNIKQAVAPKKPLDELWSWAEEQIAPDVIVLTEAKVPKTGVPRGWTAQWTEGGIGPRRTWGTVVAGRGVELRPITELRSGEATVDLQFEWPAAVTAVDVVRDGQRWATVVGLYAITLDDRGESCGHGAYSLPLLMRQLEPLIDSDSGERLVIAGDMNLWPTDVTPFFESYGFVDVIHHTASTRGPLAGCASCRGTNDRCGHMWTHKNGNGPNSAIQQIDYIMCTEELAEELSTVYGGVAHFQDAWSVSDHAPVVAEFRSDW